MEHRVIFSPRSKISGFSKGRTSSAGLAKLLEALLDVGHDVRVCAKGELGVGNAGRGSNSRAIESRNQCSVAVAAVASFFLCVD